MQRRAFLVGLAAGAVATTLGITEVARHVWRPLTQRERFLEIHARALRMRAELLDHVALDDEDQPLTPDELARVQAGMAEIARGEYVTLQELRYRIASTRPGTNVTASEVARAAVAALNGAA